MAYNHSQLGRECGAVKTPSARLLLMVLASAMDKDKHTCNWRVSTLLHYTKLSEATYKRAMNEIELAGIVTRDKRLGKSSTFIWHPDVAESLRDPVRKDWAEPSKEQKKHMDRMDLEGYVDDPEHADQNEVPAQAFMAEDDEEEYACSQCKIEPVLVAGARCQTCIAASRAEDERIAKERAAAKAAQLQSARKKLYRECRSDDEHEFVDGNPKCFRCNVSRSLIEDSIRERNERNAALSGAFDLEENP